MRQNINDVMNANEKSYKVRATIEDIKGCDVIYGIGDIQNVILWNL